MSNMWVAAVALAHSPLIIGLALMLAGALWVDQYTRRG